MRLFVAIDIPDSVQSNLRTLLNRLRPLADFRWSDAQNLHITTKFIGEWPEARLAEMKQALAAIPPPASFEISVHGLGWFPNPHHPRVFWAGVDGGEPLRTLATLTADATSRLGVAHEDREFRPHLTLARLKGPTPLESSDKLNAVRRGVASLDSQEFGSFRAAAFTLYLSAGGKYTRLAGFPLTNPR